MNKITKRLLAILLAIAMTVPNMQMSVFAEVLNNSDQTATEEIAGEEENVAEKEVTEDVADESETEETAEEPEAEALAEEVMPLAEGKKPADGTTSGQPFAKGTGESTYFRIPAMVTLSDGTIVAAADARWNTTLDGGGLDTMVSYSTDNGATWKYTYANYFGDNGNAWNTNSTAFIDPALATDGKTVYMLVDLYPGGVGLNGATNKPVEGTGFDNQGRLMLTNSKDSNSYYVGSFSNGKADIYRKRSITSDTKTNYTVDEYYNLYDKNGTQQGNIFYNGAAYQVTKTNYLYLTKSTDGGATWSAPTILNPQIKNGNETFYGVGPGNGLVTSTGRIIFTCYTNPDEFTSVIYSDDQGKTWKRSASMNANSSEATVVEADGRLYMFTRYDGYYVSEDDGTTWSSRKETTGADTWYWCQRSTITYSEKIDGKTAILLSCPSGGARSNGKIYVALVNEDGSLDFKYQYKVTDGEFSYSCLTELNDGNVALLYENASGSILYETYPIDEIIGVVPGFVDNAGKTVESVSFTEGDAAKILKFNGVKSNQTLTIASKDENVATVAYDETTGAVTVSPVKTGNTVLTATVQDNTRAVAEYELKVTVKAKEVTVVDITIPVGFEKKMVISSGDMTTKPNEAIATAKIEEVNAGYKPVEKIEAGKQYLLVNDTAARAVLTQTAGTNGKAKGFALKATNATDIITGAEYADYLWTLEESGDGKYALKAKNGQYLYMDGDYNKQDVHLQNEAFYGTLTDIGNGKYRFSNGNACLENQSTANTLGTAWWNYSYTDGNQVWHFYEYDPGYHLTIKGVAPGKTTMVIGGVTYNITVREQTPEDILGSGLVANKGQGTNKVITKLTTNVGMIFDVNLKDKLLSGQTVEWVSDDPNVASVDQNGTISGVTVGNTIVKAVVKDSTGKVVAENPIVVTVLAGNGSDGTGTDKVFDFYIDKIEDTRVYYSLNCTSNLVEVKEHEAIYLSFDEDSNAAMNFFGDPDDGYALTFMNAPGSAGEYESLQDKTNPKNTDFYKLGAARNQTGPFGDKTVCDMIQKAMDMGSDGAQGFTRAASDKNDCKFTLSFRSEKLPEITKEVVAIRHEDRTREKYYEGMTAVVGDEVFFKVVVHKEAYKDRIDYTNIKFIDAVDGMVLYNTDESYVYPDDHNNRTVDFGTEFSTTDEITKTYYVGYKVGKNDLDSTILNTAQLTHTYSSQYSKGSFEGSANADAKISATSFNPKDIVVDFGLPVAINFKDLEGNNKDLVKGKSTAKYGSVEVNNNLHSITYTPNKVLTEKDTITLTVVKNSSNQEFEVTFDVYPATSVYYEEGFASYKGSWSGATMGTGIQAMHEVGSKALYGYDDAYSTTNKNSGDSVSVSKTVNDTAEFIFNGTGADIYALTKNDSGSMSMWLYDEAGNLLKLGFVNTAQKWISENDGKDYYNTPVFSYRGLTEGTYKVVMRVQSGEISLDGFRVYNTQGDVYNDAYAKDKEDSAQTVEVRDVTIAGSTYDLADIEDWYKYGENIIKAVYDATNDGSGAIILGEGNQITADADMINNGPKNEIYLKPGQTIAMKINGEAAKVAIGMRSLNGGNISYKINKQAEATTLTSTVDMYYDVKTQLNDGVLVIQNSGDTVIALTKLKATQFKGREAALAASISCDADTVAYALKCIAGVPEVEEPVEEAPQAFLTEVVSTKRTDGKYDIRFIAQLVVPEGYKLDAAGLVWSNKGAAYNDEVKLDIANFGKDKAVKVTNISKINTKWQYSVTIKGVPSSVECVPGRAFATMVKGDGTTVQSTIELGYTK